MLSNATTNAAQSSWTSNSHKDFHWNTQLLRMEKMWRWTMQINYLKDIVDQLWSTAQSSEASNAWLRSLRSIWAGNGPSGWVRGRFWWCPCRLNRMNMLLRFRRCLRVRGYMQMLTLAASRSRRRYGVGSWICITSYLVRPLCYFMVECMLMNTVVGNEERDNRSVNIRNRDNVESQAKANAIPLQKAIYGLKALRDERRLVNSIWCFTSIALFIYCTNSCL